MEIIIGFLAEDIWGGIVVCHVLAGSKNSLRFDSSYCHQQHIAAKESDGRVCLLAHKHDSILIKCFPRKFLACIPCISSLLLKWICAGSRSYYSISIAPSDLSVAFWASVNPF